MNVVTKPRAPSLRPFTVNQDQNKLVLHFSTGGDVDYCEARVKETSMESIARIPDTKCQDCCNGYNPVVSFSIPDINHCSEFRLDIRCIKSIENVGN